MRPRHVASSHTGAILTLLAASSKILVVVGELCGLAPQELELYRFPFSVFLGVVVLGRISAGLFDLDLT